ncbi:MAG: YidC/Oxa1 family membrane protein insertase [Actinomycetota bacterium]|nr:YidC/Oxa1 family membrane protein insertase [Actinomycetota bacterium]
MFDAFDGVFEAMAAVVAWFYSITGSIGWSIVLLTLSVMVVLTPLTLKGTRSMLQMQALQPELKRIQKEFKGDKERLNAEMLAFYRENNVNPMGGCLPLLAQMPVFLVLYRVVQGLTRRDADGLFDPQYLDQSTDLYQDLHRASEMNFLGIDLAESAQAVLGDDGFVTALPYLLLIAIVAGLSFIQQWQVSGRNPNAQANPQQKMLLRVMPVFFAFISFTFQTALVLYFMTSNLYRVGQQWYIGRHIYGKKADEDAGSGGGSQGGQSGKDSPKPKGGGGSGGGSKAKGGGSGGSGGSKAKGGGSSNGRSGRDDQKRKNDKKKGDDGGSKSRSARLGRNGRDAKDGSMRSRSRAAGRSTPSTSTASTTRKKGGGGRTTPKKGSGGGRGSGG